MAGFYLGLGLCCILLAQPLLYLALGFSWLFAAFGAHPLDDVGPGQHALQLDFWLFIALVLAAAAARLMSSALSAE